MLDFSRVLNSKVDKLIIAPIFGFAILGNYYLGIQIFYLLTLLPSIIFYYTLPQDAIGKTNSKLKKLTCLASGILALLGIFLAPILIPYLFPKFLDAVLIIQILSIAIIPKTISSMYLSEFIGNQKIMTVLIGSIIFVTIQVSLILILGELYGVLGLALSMVFANIAEAGYLLSMKRIKLKN